MLIPKEMLEPPGGYLSRSRKRVKRAVVTVLASLGLSSQQADKTARKLSTIVAILAGCIVVVVAVFADRWVTTSAEKRLKEESRADLEQAARAGAAESAAAGAASALPDRTRITSSPDRVEVVVAGQPVGYTPISIAKGSEEALVLLRLPGFEPQMVRIGPQTPADLHISLQASASAAPTAPAANGAKPTP